MRLLNEAKRQEYKFRLEAVVLAQVNRAESLRTRLAPVGDNGLQVLNIFRPKKPFRVLGGYNYAVYIFQKKENEPEKRAGP